MFKDICTIYNKYIDQETKSEKWQRTVLKGIFWDSSKGAAVRKTGISSADGLQLIIPYNAQCDREYMNPKEWATLQYKSKNWTIQSGDTIIKWNIPYEVIKSSKELQSFDDVLSVISVDNRGYGGDMSHWEVMGK